jgi:hypothetical protein
MSNMSDPGRNPPRYQRKPGSYTSWIIGSVAALAVIAAIAYAMSDRSRMAGTDWTKQARTRRSPARSTCDQPLTARETVTSVFQHEFRTSSGHAPCRRCRQLCIWRAKSVRHRHANSPFASS